MLLRLGGLGLFLCVCLHFGFCLSFLGFRCCWCLWVKLFRGWLLWAFVFDLVLLGFVRLVSVWVTYLLCFEFSFVVLVVVLGVLCFGVCVVLRVL